MGTEVWTGDGLGEGGLALQMTDTRSWIEKNPLLALCLLILLLLLLLLLWIMTRKALPNKVIMASDEFYVKGKRMERLPSTFHYSKKRKEINIKSPDFPANKQAESRINLKLEPVDRRYKKSSRRGILVTGISTPSQVNAINIGKPYVRDKNKRWVPEGVESDKAVQINQKLGAIIELETGSGNRSVSSLLCKIEKK
jgi:hypothetical protein